MTITIREKLPNGKILKASGSVSMVQIAQNENEPHMTFAKILNDLAALLKKENDSLEKKIIIPSRDIIKPNN